MGVIDATKIFNYGCKKLRNRKETELLVMGDGEQLDDRLFSDSFSLSSMSLASLRASSDSTSISTLNDIGAAWKALILAASAAAWNNSLGRHIKKPAAQFANTPWDTSARI